VRVWHFGFCVGSDARAGAARRLIALGIAAGIASHLVGQLATRSTTGWAERDNKKQQVALRFGFRNVTGRAPGRLTCAGRGLRVRWWCASPPRAGCESAPAPASSPLCRSAPTPYIAQTPPCSTVQGSSRVASTGLFLQARCCCRRRPRRNRHPPPPSLASRGKTSSRSRWTSRRQHEPRLLSLILSCIHRLAHPPTGGGFVAGGRHLPSLSCPFFLLEEKRGRRPEKRARTGQRRRMRV
jgi:hypothetical protein